MPRAAVCREFGHPLSVEEVTLDPPRENEVRVRVSACAVCHSDVAYADGAWGGTLPAVYGHEACGVVARDGAGRPGARGRRPGGGQPGPQLRRLRAAAAKAHRRCARRRFRLDADSPIRLADGGRAEQGMRCGAFADEVVVHASQAVPIPDWPPRHERVPDRLRRDDRHGRGCHDAAVAPGSAVAVIGAGGVGLNAVQGAALAGAGHVIAVDVAEPSSRAARSMGATGTSMPRPPTPWPRSGRRPEAAGPTA